jgi:hypothetical protein
MDENSMVVALAGQICGTILIISLIVAWVTRRRQTAIKPNDGLQRIESRLSEMQQSLDAVAVEVERISEGQRFATKVLSERAAAAVPDATGSREPLPRGAVR